MNGTYLATVKSHVLKDVGDNKTPCVSVKLETVENVVTGEPCIDTVYASVWLTDKAFERTMETLTEVMGWDGDDLSDLDGTGLLEGKQVWVVLEEETWEGKTKTNVKYINKVGGRPQVTLDPAKAKALAAGLKGRILAYRQANKATDSSDVPANVKVF